VATQLVQEITQTHKVKQTLEVMQQHKVVAVAAAVATQLLKV
jgi:hypothetical protein